MSWIAFAAYAREMGVRIDWTRSNCDGIDRSTPTPAVKRSCLGRHVVDARKARPESRGALTFWSRARGGGRKAIVPVGLIKSRRAGVAREALLAKLAEARGIDRRRRAKERYER